MVTVHFQTADGAVRTLQGEPGQTVMQLATRHDVPGIASDCGGCVSCGTCHALVAAEFLARLPAPSEAEQAMLECLVDPRPESRLSCQIVLTPDLDGLTVNVPPAPF